MSWAICCVLFKSYESCQQRWRGCAVVLGGCATLFVSRKGVLRQRLGACTIEVLFIFSRSAPCRLRASFSFWTLRSASFHV